MPQLKEIYDPFDEKHGAFVGGDTYGGDSYESSMDGLAQWGFKVSSA